MVNNVMARCLNEEADKYEYYGGRGILIHDEWIKVRYKFIEYLSTLPGVEDDSLVLDRADNDGHYEPGNLRFVTHSESCFNRRPFGHKQQHGDAGRFAKKSQAT